MKNTNTQNVLDNIFSSPSFKDFNAEELIEKFSKSSALRVNNEVQKSKDLYKVQTESGISEIPSDGIIIKEPGNYHFTNSITWSPNTPGSAIRILANDVVLDLGGFSLTIDPPSANSSHQYNGITLGISDKDLTISNAISVKNGSINGATYYGLNALQTKNLQLNNLTISDISYTETTKADLTACGIFIDSSEAFNIQNCVVENMNVEAPSCAGIQLVATLNGNVSNCTMKNFTNKDGGVQGFSYLESSNINTNSCTSSTFRSHYKGLTKTTGHTVIGYVPIFCTNLEFNDCSTDNMVGCCDDCHGFSVFIDINVAVNNFHASNITDGDCIANTGAKATGLEVYGDNITVESCKAENITAIVPQDLQSAGFSAWGNNISFDNCTAVNVQVLDANRKSTTKHGYATGFGWAPDPRPEFRAQAANKVQYNNCNVYNSQLGFDTWFHTNSEWNNVMSYSGSIFILAELPGTKRVLSMNKCSESPTGLPENVTIENIASNNKYPELQH